jgi:hypothetical protein
MKGRYVRLYWMKVAFIQEEREVTGGTTARFARARRVT